MKKKFEKGIKKMYNNIEVKDMPIMTVTIDEIAKSIEKMNKQELETLSLILSKSGKELLKRKKEIESGKVKSLKFDEVF
ncbi:MAG: hypothetical protein JXB50_15775 [Spirochaetes bacterium]|nr:hypothetical protein [Spirochaetota bacterium]